MRGRESVPRATCMDESEHLSAPEPAPELTSGSATGFTPLTFGETLDRVFRLVRTHWRLFAQSSVWVLVATLVLILVLIALFFAIVHPTALQNQTINDPQKVLALFAAWAPCLLILYSIFFLFEAVLTRVALRITATEPVETRALPWGRALALGWLRGLAIAVPLFAVMVLLGGATAVAAAYGHGQMAPGGVFFLFPLWVIGYVGAMAYAVFAIVSLSFAYPVLLEEDRTAWRSFWRSLPLTRGLRGRIFLVSLVICAISCAAFLAIELLGIATFGIGALLIGLLHLPQAVTVVAGVVAGVLFAALYAVCYVLTFATYVTGFVVLYREQQRRRAALGPAAD